MKRRSQRSAPGPVLLVAPSGGHLLQLVQLLEANWFSC